MRDGRVVGRNGYGPLRVKTTTRPLFRVDHPVLGARRHWGVVALVPGDGRMFREPAIAILAVAMVLIASLHVTASPHLAVATLDAQAIVARDAFACQSPWQVIKGRDCHKLPAGTEVNIVSGDEFFACVVWPGTQRCLWIARDVLRKP